MFSLSSKYSTLEIQVTNLLCYQRLVVKELTTLFSAAYLMPLWLCVHRCHVHVQITACRQMSRGGAKQRLRPKALSQPNPHLHALITEASGGF